MLGLASIRLEMIYTLGQWNFQRGPMKKERLQLMQTEELLKMEVQLKRLNFLVIWL